MFLRLPSISSNIYNIHKYTSFMYTAPPSCSGGCSTSPQIFTIYTNILHICIQLHLQYWRLPNISSNIYNIHKYTSYTSMYIASSPGSGGCSHLLKHLKHTSICIIYVYSSTSRFWRLLNISSNI